MVAKLLYGAPLGLLVVIGGGAVYAFVGRTRRL